MNHSDSFGTRLRKARENQGFTQSALAEKINIGSGSISQWERDAGSPGIDHLRNLCSVLNVSADALLGISGSHNHNHINETASGIEWRVVAPYDEDPHATRKQLCIELFSRLVSHKKQFREIAKEPTFRGHSSLELSRMLRASIADGTIELLQIPRNERLEEKLISHYPALHTAVVANLDLIGDSSLENALRTESVAHLASKYAIKSIPPAGSVGISGGHLISRLTDLIPKSDLSLAGVTWVPLIETMPTEALVSTTSNVLTAKLAQTQPHTSSLKMLYLHSDWRSKQQSNDLSLFDASYLNQAYRVLNTARNVDCIITSTGQPTFNPKKLDVATGLGSQRLNDLLQQLPRAEQAGCAGVILLYMVDNAGSLWGPPAVQAANKEMFSSIELDDLRAMVKTDKPVWFLCNTGAKVRSTHAAFAGGMGNCLIADAQSAAALLSMPI